MAAVILEHEADPAQDHGQLADQEHPPADRHSHGGQRRGYAHEQRPPAVRAEEAQFARALIDLAALVVLGTQRQPPPGEPHVETGEESEPHRQRERRGARRVVGEVPVDHVNTSEEHRTAKEQVTLDLHEVSPAFGSAAAIIASSAPPSAGVTGAGPDRLPLGLAVPAGLDVWVMQIECGPLRPDPRYRGKIVPWWRAGCGPLQRVAEAPRVVGGDPLPVLPALVDGAE